ncbi:MAG: DUF2480 family protein [Chitinophagaceae bacterium]|nr:DUF2480 family protein [Chitinophagaceae bacterium]
MQEKIINKIANSNLTTIPIEDFIEKGERIFFDVKDILYQGIIIREKDIRDFLKKHNWNRYQGTFVAVDCSVDAIIPPWVYMLIASEIESFAKVLVKGNLKDLEKKIYEKKLESIHWEEYKHKKILIKGCNTIYDADHAFFELTKKLKPFVHSIFYGEACSNVPIYKRNIIATQN